MKDYNDSLFILSYTHKWIVLASLASEPRAKPLASFLGSEARSEAPKLRSY